MHSFKVISTILLLLTLIISMGITTNNYLSNSSETLENYLVEIRSDVEKEHWESAEENIEILVDKWSSIHNVWVLVLNHSEIDNIEISIVKLKECIYTQDISSILVEIATLEQYINHIPEKEICNITNIL